MNTALWTVKDSTQMRCRRMVVKALTRVADAVDGQGECAVGVLRKEFK